MKVEVIISVSFFISHIISLSPPTFRISQFKIRLYLLWKYILTETT